MKRRIKYKTWQECTEAVKELTPLPTTASEYSVVYKKNPRLPSNPNIIYSDFPGWSIFLGRIEEHDKKNNKYGTWQEAALAIKKLNPVPTSVSEYRKLKNQDSRLPYRPDLSLIHI